MRRTLSLLGNSVARSNNYGTAAALLRSLRARFPTVHFHTTSFAGEPRISCWRPSLLNSDSRIEMERGRVVAAENAGGLWRKFVCLSILLVQA